MTNPKQSKTLHIEMLGEELSVYDWKRLKMHSLNPTATKVFALCDGTNSPAQMAARLTMPEAAIWQALDELSKAHLLQAPAAAPSDMSRRQFLKLGGAVAAAAIVSIVVPHPVAAQSGGGGGGATGPITRTVTVGTLPGDGGVHYYAFTTPITDAEFAAYEAAFGVVNQMTLSWDSGNNNPTHATNVRLVRVSGGDGAFGFLPPPAGTNSPYIGTNSNFWTGDPANHRPFNGLDAGLNAASADFVMGDVTITLEHV
jgi:hypothetical protein